MEAFRAHRLLISNSNEKTTFQWSKVVSEAIFPTHRGMLVFRSGLRFSFWALEVLEPRVRKRFMEKCKKNHNHFAKFGGRGPGNYCYLYLFYYLYFI